MQTGALVAIDEEVDNVEEVQGSPGEEEEHAHAHQNPEKDQTEYLCAATFLRYRRYFFILLQLKNCNLVATF